MYIILAVIILIQWQSPLLTSQAMTFQPVMTTINLWCLTAKPMAPACGLSGQMPVSRLKPKLLWLVFVLVILASQLIKLFLPKTPFFQSPMPLTGLTQKLLILLCLAPQLMARWWLKIVLVKAMVCHLMLFLATTVLLIRVSSVTALIWMVKIAKTLVFAAAI